MYRAVCLTIITSLCTAACVSDPGGQSGQVQLALTGTSPSGITYRLRNAELTVVALTITGADAPIVFHTEDDPTRLLITQHLEVGDYNLHLTPGWQLEQVHPDNTSETVEAIQLSPDPQVFTIVANTFTPVVVRFGTPSGPVDLATGDVGISIGVEQIDSCFDIHTGNPMAADGVYTVGLGRGPHAVFCDMTHGGITYEQLAIGNSFASYAGYSAVAAADLNDKVIGQAFIALYNMQGSSMIAIDHRFRPGNCCIKAADSGPGYLTLGGSVVLPTDLNRNLVCGFPAVQYRFELFDTGQHAPVPMPSSYFTSNPASNQVRCGDDNNPGWFFKRS